ncbi:MAG: hypothetical protein GY928_37465 [Colwellia sp.]|nr:hypothetical protein [Colwellia sp.]
MANLREVNDNILRNAEYSVKFFRYDFEMLADNVSMMANEEWVNYLNNVNTFSVPLIAISSFEKTQQIWYRNKNTSDSITIEIDSSHEHNIIEFIAKEVQYINVDLQDLNKMGVVLYVDYIDNLGNQQIKTLYVGRPQISKYVVGASGGLSIKIDQLNRFLDRSDFDKNVVHTPTGANYSYISLLQAFGNIYNVPHNIDDNYSYAGTPFRLNQENYAPTSDLDVVLRDGDLPDDVQLYAEDKVANSSGFVHSQFFYKIGDPQCGVKITKYNNDGKIIDTPITTYTAGWNVWSNTINASASWNAGSIFNGLINSFGRLFRPIKVVYAPSNEQNIIRKYRRFRTSSEWSSNPALGYTENIKTDKEDISAHNPDEGDILIYFELMGDVLLAKGVTADYRVCLFTNNSHLLCYNYTKDIVYFDRLVHNAKSTPLPKQWLDINDYFLGATVRFQDQFIYGTVYSWFNRSVSEGGAVDDLNPTPMIPVKTEANGNVHLNYQKSDHDWNDSRGSMQYVKFVCGYDNNAILKPEIPTDRTKIEGFLDAAQVVKPKSIVISSDGQKIYFAKPSLFPSDYWGYDWVPTQNQANLILNGYKTIYDTSGGDRIINENDVSAYNFFKLDTTINGSFVSEVCAFLSNHSVLGFNMYANSTISEYKNSYYVLPRGDSSFAYYGEMFYPTDKLNPSFNFFIDSNVTVFPRLNDVIFTTQTGSDETVYVGKTFGVSGDYILDIYWTTGRVIFQNNQTTELQYLNYANGAVLQDKGGVTGFEYLLSMNRDRFIFSNPIDGQSDETYKISPTINEPVRLLSFKGNRYLAGIALANTFQKNMYYDNQGVLNIGMGYKKHELTDFDLVSIKKKEYKYDSLEYFKNRIQKNNFKATDNDVVTNKEEEESTYDEATSITMWSTKDVQMDIKITRNSETTLIWEAINEFGVVDGSITETAFYTFEIPLTGIFAGISIWCNFYNTELAIGKTFYGTIEKRKFTPSTVASEIVSVSQELPFLDDKALGLKFPFLYSEYNDSFFALMNDYFKDGNKLRPSYEVDIVIPEMILFDTKYKQFSVGDIITLQTDEMYIQGYSLEEDGSLTKYNESKGDYYIEKMKLDFNSHTTIMNLVSV